MAHVGFTYQPTLGGQKYLDLFSVPLLGIIFYKGFAFYFVFSEGHVIMAKVRGVAQTG